MQKGEGAVSFSMTLNLCLTLRTQEGIDSLRRRFQILSCGSEVMTDTVVK